MAATVQGRPPRAPSRRSYLEDMLRTLWPNPTTVSCRNRFQRSDGVTTEFVVLPHLGRPVLLLPRRPRAATAGALRNYKTSAAPSARLKLRVLSWGARAGFTDLLPHRVRLRADPTAPNAGIDGYLAETLGRALVLSPMIGPPRAVQKPVLQLLTPRGETFAFAKIGVDAFTRELVRGEAANLTLLSGCGLKRLSVPEVLHHGQWRGHEVLVQRALSAAGSGAARPEALAEAMAELARAGRHGRCLLGTSPYWAKLHQQVADLPRTRESGLLAGALEGLLPCAERTQLDFGSWHGDWAPWNMAASGERVLLWDFEQFESDVPVGFDAVHYAVQRDVVGGAVGVPDAFEAARAGAGSLLSPFGVSGDNAPLIVLLYAVSIAARYLRDGEMDMGTRMGRLDGWLEPVLSRQLGMLNGASR